MCSPLCPIIFADSTRHGESVVTGLITDVLVMVFFIYNAVLQTEHS